MSKFVKKYYPYIPILLFLLYSAWIHHVVGLLEGDDMIYQNIFAEQSPLSWCKDFYRNWGGRLPLQLLDILFLNLPLICWKVWNVLLHVLIPVYVYRIVRLFQPELKDTKAFLLNLTVCVMLGMIPSDIVDPAIRWVTGSFNYLLPSAMLLVALYPFFVDLAGQGNKAEQMNKKARSDRTEHRLQKFDWVLAYVAAFLACYAEQTAAVFLCFAAFCGGYSIYRRKFFPWKHRILFLFGLVNSGIQFLAPGNGVRHDAELLRWYQTYDMYSLADKILLGVVHFMKSVFVPGFPYFVMILAMMGMLVLKRTRFHQICYLGLCLLTAVVKVVTEQLEDGVIWQIYSTKMMLQIAMILFWILLFAWSLLDLLLLERTGWIAALLFLGTVASGMVMGMSPTVFASGTRVFLLCYLLLILLAGLLAAKVLQMLETCADPEKN